MYLIYSKNDGKVWREVDIYEMLPDGGIHAGVNGVMTLTYPVEVDVDIFKVSDDEFAKLDGDHINKYMIVDGKLVEDPDWEPFVRGKEELADSAE